MSSFQDLRELLRVAAVLVAHTEALEVEGLSEMDDEADT